MEQRKILVNGRPVGQTPAELGKTGVQLSRQQPRKRFRLPEVKDVGAAVRQVLEHHFRGVDWIDQAVDGAEQYIEKCIHQFSGTATPRNSGPIQHGSDYREYARSAEEIKETMAAEEGSVTPAPRQVPRYRQRPDEIEIPEREIADPRPRQAPLQAPPGHRILIIPETKDWVM